jgi:hypothetical protein
MAEPIDGWTVHDRANAIEHLRLPDDLAAPSANKGKPRRVKATTAKHVLRSLAAYADAEGVAWPSQSLIAANTHLTTRAVQMALDALQAVGLVAVVAQARDEGDAARGRWGHAVYVISWPEVLRRQGERGLQRQPHHVLAALCIDPAPPGAPGAHGGPDRGSEPASPGAPGAHGAPSSHGDTDHDPDKEAHRTNGARSPGAPGAHEQTRGTGKQQQQQQGAPGSGKAAGPPSGPEVARAMATRGVQALVDALAEAGVGGARRAELASRLSGVGATPEHVGRVVERWRRRPGVGPGVLVRMLHDEADAIEARGRRIAQRAEAVERAEAERVERDHRERLALDARYAAACALGADCPGDDRAMVVGLLRHEARDALGTAAAMGRTGSEAVAVVHGRTRQRFAQVVALLGIADDEQAVEQLRVDSIDAVLADARIEAVA